MRNLRRVPIVTITIALMTTIIYILDTLNHEEMWARLSADWTLLYHQPWRLISSPFLHHNFFHFIGNLLFLILFGWQIENSYGRLIVSGVFFGGLVTGHFMSITVAHDWIVGISVGVAGLFGFSLIANRQRPWWKTLTHNALHAVYFVGLVVPLIPFFADQIGYRVSHFSHLGGILYGLAFGVAYILSPTGSWRRWAVTAVPFLLIASIFYSPWQPEWQLVKRQPVLVTQKANCQLKSPDQAVYVSAPITFVNSSPKPIGVYWLDYEGKPQYKLLVMPGHTGDQNSFIGHPFCIVDTDKIEAIQAVTVTEPNQIFTIR
jgi:membrane associated rhomboid family serine protease